MNCIGPYASALAVLLMLGHSVYAADRLPNVVLIVADDLGYADLGCFGAKDIRTPRLDRMAAEGARFTSFNVAQAVCTASRAALMSGCYPNRIGLSGALHHTSTNGIHADETLLHEGKRGIWVPSICRSPDSKDLPK